MKIFNFKLGEKLDQYFDVKFDEESECGGFEFNKSPRDSWSDLLKAPKIEIFIFELEEKLDQHFHVKFNGESDSGSPGA